MNVIETKIEGVKLIEPKVFGDERGFFMESFQADRYKKAAGIEFDFVQDNHSRSQRNVLRGLHYQKKRPQGKLVRVSRGTVFDVAVDIRPQSQTFAEWVGFELSDSNARQLWVPPGLAHGFLVLSDIADFEYKCTDYYDAGDEGALLWNDSEIGIDWPPSNPILSKKDQAALKFAQLIQ